MSYELWDDESGNRLGWYKDEAAALAVVRAMLAEYGEASVTAWSLAEIDVQGHSREVASGADLAQRASGEVSIERSQVLSQSA